MNDQDRATAAVVEFITQAKWKDFPPDAVALAKRCAIDGLGVMLAGSTTRGSAILRDYIRTSDGSAEATVIGQQVFRTSTRSAALANGASGHAMDWDDTQLSATADRIFGLLTHPTVPPLAAALAIGERMGASGTQFLEAFLTGFEVECKIAEAIHPNHYKKGFHSSGTIGTFGAMVAAAKLLGLNADRTAHALSIAASMCAGIRVNFGTMTKPLHVGNAAQNGIMAAELAERGFTGGDDGLDGPWGFFQIFSFGDGFDPARIIGKLGNPHTIVNPGISIKPYPCGVLGHPTMDAMRTLVTRHDVKPDQIRAIRVRAASNVAKIAGAFGMKVLAWGPRLTIPIAAAAGAEFKPLDDLLQMSDIVSIHASLTPESRGLIDARRIGLIKPTAYLVNTARGPVVDESALVAALAERRIAGAGLDVFDTEPLPAGHPLTHLKNVILTPHIGWLADRPGI